MVAYYYATQVAIVKGSPNTLAANVSVLVYDVTDTGYTTPLTVYSDPALTVITNITTDAYGIPLTDFYTNNKPNVLWKSGTLTGMWATSTSRAGANGAPGAPGAPGATGPQGPPGVDGAGTNADVAAYIPVSGPTRDALDARFPTRTDITNAAYVPAWKAATAYTAGQRVINPDGDVVTASANFTSGATYSATNWITSIARWVKPALATGTDLNSLTAPGVYPVTTFAIANSLVNAPRSPNTGSVEVLPNANGSIKQRFIFSNGFNEPRVVERAGTTGPWVPTTRLPEPLISGDDIRTFTVSGTYSTASATTAAALVGLPSEVAGQPGTLTVDTKYSSSTAYRAILEWTTLPYAVGVSPRKFVMSRTEAGQHMGWAERAYAVPPSEDTTPVPHKREMTLQRSRLRHGGKRGTSGKAVVVLSFDHGFKNFRDRIKPELIRLGLPATLAVNPDTLNVTGESETVTYADLQSWAIASGFELANHSKSHNDATTTSAMKDAIVGALDLIRANCPKVTVDSYIMPGVSGTMYNGFNAGVPESQWWSHPAGRIILDNHAVVTSLMGGYIVPVTGSPVQTMTRLGVEQSSWATTAETKVVEAEKRGAGIHIYTHPSRVGETGYITTARFTQMLEFIAAERDAGRVEVMTLSGMAWADVESSKVFDLSNSSSWGTGTQAIDVSTDLTWARGSTWELSATGAGSVTLTATDDTGALNTTVTATPGSARLRLPFTIPLDSTTVTVTATGGTSPVVLAV